VPVNISGLRKLGTAGGALVPEQARFLRVGRCRFHVPRAARSKAHTGRDLVTRLSDSSARYAPGAELRFAPAPPAGPPYYYFAEEDGRLIHVAGRHRSGCLALQEFEKSGA
jgi:hypothetical protein